jgi:hypothetical protein
VAFVTMVFREIIIVSLFSSTCGLIMDAGLPPNLFAGFDHVFVDVDGTINAHHPEQNPTEKYFPKDREQFPAESADHNDAYNAAWEKGSKFRKQSWFPEGLNHYVEDSEYSNYKWGESLQAENTQFVHDQLQSLGEKLVYFIAVAKKKLNPDGTVKVKAGWNLDDYSLSLGQLGFSPPGGDAKITEAAPGDAVGAGYVAKANTIRKLVGCEPVTTVSKFASGHDQRDVAVNNYKLESDVPDCPALEKVLVIDDCPFTMSAYRVHLSFMLRGMKTLFVAPHFSIINDAEVMNFLQAPDFDNVKYRSQPPYAQYSSDKPAMGIDVVESETCVPEVGQSVYWINRESVAERKQTLEGETMKRGPKVRQSRAEMAHYQNQRSAGAGAGAGAISIS